MSPRWARSMAKALPPIVIELLFAVPRKTQIENPSENVSKIIPPKVAGSHPARGRICGIIYVSPLARLKREARSQEEEPLTRNVSASQDGEKVSPG